MNEAQCARTMQIIDTHGRDPAALIAILQDVQAENSYLSQENLELIAKEPSRRNFPRHLRHGH